MRVFYSWGVRDNLQVLNIVFLNRAIIRYFPQHNRVALIDSPDILEQATINYQILMQKWGEHFGEACDTGIIGERNLPLAEVNRVLGFFQDEETGVNNEDLEDILKVVGVIR